MVEAKSKWEDELGRWLQPFLDRLGHKARRRMCPLYISGLIDRVIARASSRWRRGWHQASMTTRP